MSQHRAIVVGAGGISNAWFGPLKNEKVNVLAVVDQRIEAAHGQIETYQLTGTRAFDDLGKALSELKGQAEFLVDLTTPNAHCPVTIAALEAGLHVIGEKPMATDLPSARKMIKTSEKTGKMFMVSQSRRWNAKHESIVRTISHDGIGRLTTLNCDFFLAAHFGGFRDEMDSPLILDMAIHHFDLARMFSQRDGMNVYAEEFNPAGSWYRGAAAANCLFEMTGGVRFAFRGSWCAEGPPTSWHGDWRLIGERGSLIYAGDHPPTGEVVNASVGFMRPRTAAKIFPWEMPLCEMHGGLCEMLAYLDEGRIPQTECHKNFNSLAMVVAAIESSHSGVRVKVEGIE
jgi:predicted dehydrogenase